MSYDVFFTLYGQKTLSFGEVTLASMELRKVLLSSTIRNFQGLFLKNFNQIHTGLKKKRVFFLIYHEKDNPGWWGLYFALK